MHLCSYASGNGFIMVIFLLQIKIMLFAYDQPGCFVLWFMELEKHLKRLKRSVIIGHKNPFLITNSFENRPRKSVEDSPLVRGKKVGGLDRCWKEE